LNLGLLSRFSRRERRDCPRQPVHFDVMYGVGQDFKLSTAIDISEVGLSFLSRIEIPEGTRLNMRLFMDRGDQEDMVQVRAVVIRHDGESTAVVFENLSRADRQRILAHLNQTAPV
jgi:hypothetical protein